MALVTGTGMVLKNRGFCTPRRLVAAALLASTFAVGQATAQQALTLASGDSISFSIVGSPELDRIATIGPGGMVQVPLAGPVEASGLTLAELQVEIASAISAKAFRVSGQDTDESWRRVAPSELVIDVVSYRPVYIVGDVVESGEFPFLPGMTVRQAVAKAGGLGNPITSEVSELQILSLSTQRDLIIGQIETTRATLDRLETDLERISEGTPFSSDFELNMDDTAKSWLQARSAQREITESNTLVRLDQMRNRLEVLQELQEAQDISLDIERKELERAQTLAERGVVAASAVSDARRGVLQTSMQALETSGEIHRLRLDMAKTSDEIGLERSNQQIEVLTQIAERRALLDGLVRQLDSLERRLVAMGGDAFLSPENVSYSFVLHRFGVETPMQFEQLNSDLLMPGDVLEVTANVIDAATRQDF